MIDDAQELTPREPTSPPQRVEGVDLCTWGTRTAATQTSVVAKPHPDPGQGPRVDRTAAQTAGDGAGGIPVVGHTNTGPVWQTSVRTTARLTRCVFYRQRGHLGPTTRTGISPTHPQERMAVTAGSDHQQSPAAKRWPTRDLHRFSATTPQPLPYGGRRSAAGRRSRPLYVGVDEGVDLMGAHPRRRLGGPAPNVGITCRQGLAGGGRPSGELLAAALRRPGSEVLPWVRGRRYLRRDRVIAQPAVASRRVDGRRLLWASGGASGPGRGPWQQARARRGRRPTCRRRPPTPDLFLPPPVHRAAAGAPLPGP